MRLTRHRLNLWLDDVRPAPFGWVHVRTVAEAQAYLRTGRVERASLDHDLGACAACMDRWRAGLVVDGMMPNCEHYGTGYTLVCWMEETGHWPAERPRVHSANPVGRQRMEAAIGRHWGPGAGGGRA